MKRFVFLLSICFVIVFTSNVCFAAPSLYPGELDKPSGEIIFEGQKFQVNIVKPLSRSEADFICTYNSSIKRVGNTFEILADTDTYYNVDSISICIYLQNWNGSSWVTVEMTDSNIVYDNDFCTASGITGACQSESYYRAKIVYTAIDNRLAEVITYYSPACYMP